MDGFRDLAHKAQVFSTHWCNLVNLVQKLTIATHIINSHFKMATVFCVMSNRGVAMNVSVARPRVIKGLLNSTVGHGRKIIKS